MYWVTETEAEALEVVLAVALLAVALVAALWEAWRR